MKNSNIDRLVTDLQSMISKYRCSFSNEEINVLNESIRKLKESKKAEIRSNVFNSIIRIFLKAVSNDSIQDFLKDLF